MNITVLRAILVSPKNYCAGPLRTYIVARAISITKDIHFSLNVLHLCAGAMHGWRGGLVCCVELGQNYPEEENKLWKI